MRSAYQQMVNERGQHKGFTNEGISNLMKLDGASGPLDYSQNEQRSKDVHHHNLNKISSKISSTQ